MLRYRRRFELFCYDDFKLCYCKFGLKWHSLLFTNNRKLVQMFAVVYSAVVKGHLHAKKCLVQFEYAPVTPSARVQIQLDEGFLDVFLNCVYCTQNY